MVVMVEKTLNFLQNKINTAMKKKDFTRFRRNYY